MPVPFPRDSLSRHSARYIGTTTPTRPADAPWSVRPTVRSMKLPPSNSPDRHITGIDTKKQNAESMMIFLRPNHSASVPAKSDEITEPHSTAPTMNPSWKLE